MQQSLCCFWWDRARVATFWDNEISHDQDEIRAVTIELFSLCYLPKDEAKAWLDEKWGVWEALPADRNPRFWGRPNFQTIAHELRSG